MEIPVSPDRKMVNAPGGPIAEVALHDLCGTTCRDGRTHRAPVYDTKAGQHRAALGGILRIIAAAGGA